MLLGQGPQAAVSVVHPVESHACPHRAHLVPSPQHVAAGGARVQLSATGRLRSVEAQGHTVAVFVCFACASPWTLASGRQTAVISPSISLSVQSSTHHSLTSMILTRLMGTAEASSTKPSHLHRCRPSTTRGEIAVPLSARVPCTCIHRHFLPDFLRRPLLVSATAGRLKIKMSAW